MSERRGAVSRVPAFIEARRSIRAFRPDPVERGLLDSIVEAACIAPAPHHSRPWRWVVVDSAAAMKRVGAVCGMTLGIASTRTV